MLIKRMIFLDPDAPCNDPIDALLSRLAADADIPEDALVFRIHRNLENGNIAVLPTTAKSEAAWELRALAMHANQKPVPKLAEKPAEVWGGVTIERGD